MSDVCTVWMDVILSMRSCFFALSSSLCLTTRPDNAPLYWSVCHHYLSGIELISQVIRCFICQYEHCQVQNAIYLLLLVLDLLYLSTLYLCRWNRRIKWATLCALAVTCCNLFDWSPTTSRLPLSILSWVGGRKCVSRIAWNWCDQRL